MSKHDQELVPKGAAKKAIDKATRHDKGDFYVDPGEFKAAIDALDPVPVSKTLSAVEGAENAVSRDMVLRSLDITREKLAPSLNEGQHLDLIRLGQLIAKLPSVSVPPAQAAGPEEPEHVIFKDIQDMLVESKILRGEFLKNPSYEHIVAVLSDLVDEIQARHTPACADEGSATGQANASRHEVREKGEGKDEETS